MKYILFLYIISSYIHAQTYTFLVKKYDKELELESKIISKIAKSLISKDIVLFIPGITDTEKEIYKKKFTLGKTCEESNFIFVKNNIQNKGLCLNKNKVYFADNYRKLIKNEIYFGAFFWSKNRPNIVFIKNKLQEKNIKLPNSYKQFIEDI